MLSHTDLKKGIIFIFNNQPFEVLEASFNFRGRGSSTVAVKIRNLTTGNVVAKTVRQGKQFKEAEIKKKGLKFLYAHRGQSFFCEAADPGQRFSLNQEQIGTASQFLKNNLTVKGLFFKDQFIKIEMPIKIVLKVKEAPPVIKSASAKPSTKQIALETGAQINVPAFIKQDDLIEVNTETGEYVRRIE